MFEEDSENEDFNLIQIIQPPTLQLKIEENHEDDFCANIDQLNPRLFHCLGSNFKFNSEFHENGLLRGNEIEFLRTISRNTINNKDSLVHPLNHTDEETLTYALLDLQSIGQTMRRMINSKECDSNKKFYLTFREKSAKSLKKLRYALTRNIYNFEFVNETLINRIDRYLSAVTIPEIVQLNQNVEILDKKLEINLNYHFFHYYLETQWYCLTSKNVLLQLYKKLSNENQTEFTEAYLSDSLASIIQNLIFLACEQFEKVPLSDIRTETPFPCLCAKEFWLLLQFYFETNNLNFWSFFHQTINETLKEFDQVFDNISVFNKNDEKKDIFILWLTFHVARLHGFDSQGFYLGAQSGRISTNYEVFNNHVSQALNVFSTKNDEMGMRVLLYLTSATMSDLWSPQLETLHILWEYFHKKINTMFFIKDLAEVAVIPKKASNFLAQIRSRLKAEHVDVFLQKQPFCTSYSLFLKLLGHFIEDCFKNDVNIKQWSRLKGRIFSKFPISRFEYFNESGLYNVLSLYFTMALTANLKEIGVELESIFITLLKSQGEKYHSLALSCHLALMILYIENSISIVECVTPLLELIKRMQQPRFTSATVENFEIIFDGFKSIFDLNQPFIYGQDALIGSWIEKCLSSTELKSLKLQICEVLHQIIEQILVLIRSKAPANTYKKITENLFQYALPYCKRNCDNEKMINLAVCFTRLSLNDEAYTKIFSTLLEYFVLETSVDVSKEYLSQLLLNEPKFNDDVTEFFSPKNESCFVIVQSWIHMCVFSMAANCSKLATISKFVLRLSILDRALSCSFRERKTNLNRSEIVCDFFQEIGQNFKALQDSKEVLDSRILMHKCLNGFERKLDVFLRIVPSSGEIIQWVYLSIGKLVYHCAPMIHSQLNSCLIKVLISKMLLPSALYRGKRLHAFYVDAIRNSWHLFVSGLFTLTNQKNCATNTEKYVETTVQDMVVQYIKYFEPKLNKTQPFVVLFHEAFFNEKLISIVLAKISSDILEKKPQSEHISITIAILLEVFRSIVANEDKLVLFLDGILKGLFLQIIMYESNGKKHAAIDLVEEIIVILPKNFEACDKFADVLLKVIGYQRELNINQPKDFESFLLFIARKTPLFILQSQVVPKLNEFDDFSQMAFSQDESPFKKSIDLFREIYFSRV